MSHGAFINIVDAMLDMDEVVRKYPSVASAFEAWKALLEVIPAFAKKSKNEWYEGNLDADCVSDAFYESMEQDDDDIESHCESLMAGFKTLNTDFAAATGLHLGLTYVGEAEDSYADISEQWVYYAIDAYPIPELTPTALASGLSFKRQQWVTYG
ncbi:hypothetical protein LBMAG53_22160 [Planctomycetota bacterium]|nr:hypothetical protein LBMAG53_22160 [Planctomycetota bacterium]